MQSSPFRFLWERTRKKRHLLTRPATPSQGSAGSNPNAALTVFRHLDSASVSFGLVGDYPETAWIIDYPLLERIHYLLVAGFDVYGNVGHQLNTRLYMDFLRMEGEFNFIALLPAAQRDAVRNYWYRDARQSVKDYLVKQGVARLGLAGQTAGALLALIVAGSLVFGMFCGTLAWSLARQILKRLGRASA